MAKQNKLITYAYFKEETGLPQNLPDEEIEHKIYRAQETLRMLMGDEFYQNYLETYKAGPLTGAYLSLYSYLKQYVAWQAYEYWTVMANYKVSRSGFRVHSEDNSEATTDAQQAIIIKDAKQQAQYYKRLLIDYLDGRASDFPLYRTHCGESLAGNSFHISAVKNKHNHDCKCKRCKC